MDLVDALEDPARSRALFVWNMNPLASCPQQTRLRRALEREDLLTGALDLFPTAPQLADMSCRGELFGVRRSVASYFHLTLSAQTRSWSRSGLACESGDFRRLGAP